MLAIFRRNHQDRLRDIRPIRKPVRNMHPHRPPIERREWLFVVLIPKAAALSGGR
jgi:hypothetical protein